jgi:hypothetical protein
MMKIDTLGTLSLALCVLHSISCEARYSDESSGEVRERQKIVAPTRGKRDSAGLTESFIPNIFPFLALAHLQTSRNRMHFVAEVDFENSVSQALFVAYLLSFLCSNHHQISGNLDFP